MKILLAVLILVCGLAYAWDCTTADVNKDGRIDMVDIGLAVKAFGSSAHNWVCLEWYEYTDGTRTCVNEVDMGPSSNWNPAADMDGNGMIDMKDIGKILACYGYTY
jgi:Ca2+-binding EF-hand superfamily protein